MITLHILSWNLLPYPLLGTGASLNIQDPAIVVHSKVTQGSDLLQENQSRNVFMTTDDTNYVL